VSVGHYENFPVASLLLPAALREPVGASTALARGADDIADEGDDGSADSPREMRSYRLQLEAPSELASLIRRHDLPVELFEDLLDAFTQDVTRSATADFSELLDYCRRSPTRSAALLLHLFKRTADSDLALLDAICSALQLINFWQDVEIDYAKGRIYCAGRDGAAPRDRTAYFEQEVVMIAWRELMRFQVERTRQMLLSGKALGRALPGRVGSRSRHIQGGLRILRKSSVSITMFSVAALH